MELQGKYALHYDWIGVIGRLERVIWHSVGGLLFVRSATPERGRAEAVKALEAARVAQTEAASHRATPAQKQKQTAELDERAQLFGDPVKQSAQAKVLERKWLRFLLVHAEECSFNAFLLLLAAQRCGAGWVFKMGAKFVAVLQKPCTVLCC